MKSPHRFASRFAFLGTLIGLVAFVPGCTSGSMTVQLDWGTSSTTCSQAGVTRMDYTLYDSFGVVSSGTNVSCGDLSFGGLAVDDYELDVYGYDGFGNELYAATCTGLFYDGVSITHRCTVPASGDPLVVDIDWDLSQTSSFVAGTCSEAGVADYDYELFDSVGNLVASDYEVACTAGALTIDFGTLPFGNYELEVTGFADDAVAYWYADCAVSPSATTTWVCQARDDP